MIATKNRSGRQYHRLPRISAQEIRRRSNRVLRILQRLSEGESCQTVAMAEGVRETAVGHVLRVLGVRRATLVELADKSRAGIVAYLDVREVMS